MRTPAHSLSKRVLIHNDVDFGKYTLIFMRNMVCFTVMYLKYINNHIDKNYR